MNVLRLIGPALSALRQGRELERAESWKNAQAVTNLLALLVVIAQAAGVHLGASDAAINTAVGLVGTAIWAAVNAYLSVATSARVGLPNASMPPIELVARSEPDGVQQSGQPEMPPQPNPQPNSDTSESVGFGDK